MDPGQALRQWRGERSLVQAAFALSARAAEFGIARPIDPVTILRLEQRARKRSTRTGKIGARACPGARLRLLIEAVVGIAATAWDVDSDHIAQTVGGSLKPINDGSNVQRRSVPPTSKASNRADEDTGLHRRDSIGKPKRKRAGGSR